MSCDANRSPCCNANGSVGCNVNCNTSCKVGCNVKGEVSCKVSCKVSCNRSCNRSRHTDSGINGAAPPPQPPPHLQWGGPGGGGGGRCWGSGPEHGGGQRGTAWHFWYRCHWPPAARARGLRVPLISPPPPDIFCPPPTPPSLSQQGKKETRKEKEQKSPMDACRGSAHPHRVPSVGPPRPPQGYIAEIHTAIGRGRYRGGDIGGGGVVFYFTVLWVFFFPSVCSLFVLMPFGGGLDFASLFPTQNVAPPGAVVHESDAGGGAAH